ncbi:hypothetical protein [Dyadobacter sp. 32]|uniref:hypothetical protein n=1 Tax=Dyadobacter sp. 32 TaxID=538966 RepID=UPI0011ED9CE9
METRKGNIWLNSFNGFKGGRIPGGLWRFFQPKCILRAEWNIKAGRNGTILIGDPNNAVIFWYVCLVLSTGSAKNKHQEESIYGYIFHNFF